MTTAVESDAPVRLGGIAPLVLEWVLLSIDRNHGRPVHISAVRLADAFGVSIRTAERTAARLHESGRVVYERPRWYPETRYESVHHMPGRYSLPAPADGR